MSDSDDTERSPESPPSREQALKDAAIEIFSRRGYHHAKVSEIVEEVGVAKGTFYGYYEGKEQIFREILSDFLGMVLETIANWEPRALDSRDALREELERVGLELTHLLMEHRRLTSIFFTETSSTNPEVESLVRKFHDALITMIAQFNRILYERDLIARADFRVLANMTIGMVERIVMEYVVHDGFEDVEPDAIVEHLVVHYLSGTREPME